MPEIATISHDALMEVNTGLPYGHIQESWRRGVFYEEAMLEHIANRYHGGSFIDIGASIGNHTVYFALRCNPDTVWAFEPVLESFDHMYRNVILNDLSIGLFVEHLERDWKIEHKMHLYNLAVGDEHCFGTMHMPVNGNEGMWIFEKVPNNEVQRQGEKGSVVMTTLDAIDIPDVTLIKIDAEGCELSILEGALETIGKYKPGIFIEAKTMADLHEIVQVLRPIGYKPIRKFNATPTYELSTESDVEVCMR